MPEFIYLDHNASTPVLPQVAEAMRACLEAPYLNPASQHAFGRRAHRVLEDARERIAELLGAHTSGRDSDQVIFTSGGTEANNLAVFGLAGMAEGRFRGKMPSNQHVIVSAIEHPSVAATVRELASGGWSVSQLAVDARGVLRPDHLTRLVRPETRLVAAMLGQNETGVLQPVGELAAICASRGVPLHTDAAQVVGKLPVDFRALGVATLSAAAHKFHGPLGIGVLVIRHGVELRPRTFGGVQQAGLRPGTEPVALAVGMCHALELWHAEREDRARRMGQLRDRFEQLIARGWPEAVIIGREAPRLPHTSNIAFVGLDRQALFMAVDLAGVACSAGSACASGSSEPSPALVAMGCPPALFGSALRFSLGATTTGPQVDESARRILLCCNDLRNENRG